MFWKRDKEVTCNGGFLIESTPIPPKKEFSVMLELLRDAEKFDAEGEKELSSDLLTILSSYIRKVQDKNKN
jgi:hypothetical protein